MSGHRSQRICKACSKKFWLQGAWRYCEECRKKYGLKKANESEVK